MLPELVCRRNGNGTDLVQGNHRGPELVVALEDQHYLVPRSDSHRKQVVGNTCAFLLHVLERVAALVHGGIQMDHCELVRILLRNRVDDVETEVELVLVLEMDIQKSSLGILGTLDELVCDELPCRRNSHAGHEVGSGIGRLILSGKDDCDEQTVRTVDCYHSVRCGRVVVDTVALVQDFLVGSDLDQQGSADDDVELLTCVGSQLDGLALKLIGILVFDPIRLGDLVFELGRQVLDVDSDFLCRLLSLTTSCDCVRSQPCGMSFQKVCDVDVEGKRALVYESERKVGLTAFICLVLGKTEIRLLCHGVLAEPHDLTHFPDSGSYLKQLCFCCIHNFLPKPLQADGIKKARPKDKFL